MGLYRPRIILDPVILFCLLKQLDGLDCEFCFASLPLLRSIYYLVCVCVCVLVLASFLNVGSVDFEDDTWNINGGYARLYACVMMSLIRM